MQADRQLIALFFHINICLCVLCQLGGKHGAKSDANVAAAVQPTVFPVAVAATTSCTTRERARPWPFYNKYADDATLPTP